MITTVLAITVIGLIVWLAMPRLTRRLIFKPEAGPHDWVEPSFPGGVIHEHVFFDTPDGETLHGWLVQQAGNDLVVLICHGNRGSIAGREETALYYLALGLNVMMFDYRGYGRSSGTPSESGSYTDVDAAWRLLTHERGFAPNQVVLLGRSLGAAVAAHLASHAQPRAVVLESTFSSLPRLARELYPILSLFRFGARYDTQSKISHITSPLLLVHSVDDELIGFHHARQLQDAAPADTPLVSITGRHRDGFVTSRAVYIPALVDFLNLSNVRKSASD
ncbi:MAG: alpha/beta hydrolase [Pseudomonadota bacterium]